jgi:hypothetical protein
MLMNHLLKTLAVLLTLFAAPAAAATLIIPLLAIAAAMKLHDHHQDARWERKRKPRAGRCWMRLAPDLAKAAPAAEVRRVRMGSGGPGKFFRPEVTS